MPTPQQSVEDWSRAFADAMRTHMLTPGDLAELLDWGRDLYRLQGHRLAAAVAQEVWAAVGDPPGTAH